MNGYKEQNYWPGFVDALSNVVLTLVFVLVVFVFALVLTSDKLQQRVEQLKNSVQVEAAAKQKAVEEKDSVEVEKQQVAKRLDETAARLLEMERDNRRLKANLGKTQIQTQPQANLEHKTQQLVEKNRQIEAQLKAAIAQLDQLGVKASLPEIVPQDQNTGREQESLIKERKTIQVLAGDAATSKGNVEFRKSGGAIILVFPRNVFKLDDKSKAALDKALQAHKERLSTSAASVISIMGAETYSESRRLAYFRGLSVRNYLMASGYSSGRTVHVQIEQDKGVKDGRVEIRFLSK